MAARKITPQESDALSQALDRVRAMLRRARDDRAALPARAQRTPAQQRQARDATDTILLARALLLLAGRQNADDLADGAGAE